eukprot:257268-Chlamydomonas_euryale.AAC.1
MQSGVHMRMHGPPMQSGVHMRMHGPLLAGRLPFASPPAASLAMASDCCVCCLCSGLWPFVQWPLAVCAIASGCLCNGRW